MHVDLTKPLPDYLLVKTETSEVLCTVEFEGNNSICIQCGAFGHSHHGCEGPPGSGRNWGRFNPNPLGFQAPHSPNPNQEHEENGLGHDVGFQAQLSDLPMPDLTPTPAHVEERDKSSSTDSFVSACMRDPSPESKRGWSIVAPPFSDEGSNEASIGRPEDVSPLFDEEEMKNTMEDFDLLLQLEISELEKVVAGTTSINEGQLGPMEIIPLAPHLKEPTNSFNWKLATCESTACESLEPISSFPPLLGSTLASTQLEVAPSPTGRQVSFDDNFTPALTPPSATPLNRKLNSASKRKTRGSTTPLQSKKKMAQPNQSVYSDLVSKINKAISESTSSSTSASTPLKQILKLSSSELEQLAVGLSKGKDLESKIKSKYPEADQMDMVQVTSEEETIQATKVKRKKATIKKQAVQRPKRRKMVAKRTPEKKLLKHEDLLLSLAPPAVGGTD